MAEGKKLPADLDEALGDPKNFQKICKITESFGIAGKGESIDILDKIFEKTLSGNLDPNNVLGEIKKGFGFSDELSNDITKEMEKQIFSNYKNSLNKLYQKEVQPVKVTTDETIEEYKPEGKIEPPTSKKEEKLTSLEEELLKEAKMPKESFQEPEIEKPEAKDEINDVLGKLSEELEKEKQKKEALNKIFRDKNGT